MGDSNASLANRTQHLASTTAGLNLFKGALDLLSSTHPVYQMTVAFAKWLGREGINESDFEYGLQCTAGLAFPNERGLAIRKSISEHQKRISTVGGLTIQIRSSIGRSLAFTQEYAYLVTTASAALKFHDADSVSTLLCELVLDHRRRVPSDETRNAYESREPVDRARLSPVIFKFAESILLNVVNPGHEVNGLPKALDHVCRHLMAPADLATGFMEVARSSTDLLAVCDHFPADLFLLVLNHFNGTVKLTIADKVIFKSAEGQGRRSFEMFVGKQCTQQCPQDGERLPGKVQLSRRTESAWVPMFMEKDDPVRTPSPCGKIPLYSGKPRWYTRSVDLLGFEDLYEIKVLVQRFCIWFWDLAIATAREYTIPGFDVYFDSGTEEYRLRMSDVLSRTPSLLYDSDGKRSGKLKPITFKAPPATPSQTSDDVSEPLQFHFSRLCDCFPQLHDLMNSLIAKCRCRNCRQKADIDDVKEGCVRYAAMRHFCMLIANAIADGFGVDDTVGSLDPTDFIRPVCSFLQTLIEGRIWWDDCFNLAAMTALGIPGTELRLGTGALVDDGGCRVALQYGSRVAAAKWLDLRRPLSANNCFSLESAEGQMEGLDDRVIFLETMPRAMSQRPVGKARVIFESGDVFSFGRTESIGSFVKTLEADEGEEPILSHAIIGCGPDPEARRLLTLASCGDITRIVDPADALLAVLKSPPAVKATQPVCHHVKDEGQTGYGVIPPLGQFRWCVWSFQDLLYNWHDKLDDVNFSVLLDTPTKVNIAFSLCKDGCLIRDPTSCLICSLHVAQQNPDLPFRIMTYVENKSTIARRTW